MRAAGGPVVRARALGFLYGVSSFVQLVPRWGRQFVALPRGVARDRPFLPRPRVEDRR